RRASGRPGGTARRGGLAAWDRPALGRHRPLLRRYVTIWSHVNPGVTSGAAYAILRHALRARPDRCRAPRRGGDRSRRLSGAVRPLGGPALRLPPAPQPRPPRRPRPDGRDVRPRLARPLRVP